MPMTPSRDLDPLGCAIVDMEQILRRMGMTAAIRIEVSKEALASLASTPSSWIRPATKGTSLRVSGAYFWTAGA